MEAQEVLQNCTVEGNIVKLPEGQLDRKLYQDVAKSLTLIGGKWKGGKVMGFVFKEDPTDLLKQVASGEKRNLKKEYQFFGTPPKLADWLVELAGIKYVSFKGKSILEPSAGQGAIIEAIRRTHLDIKVHYCELMDLNKIILDKNIHADFICKDFFFIPLKYSFDYIIANPPFTKNQDITHVLRMYECLNHGGRLVSITSESWVTGNQKKQVAFREWLDEVGAEIHDIERGAFKESGTMVGGKIVVINKPL